MAGSHYINRNGESQGQVQIINADGPRYLDEELDAVLPLLTTSTSLSKPKPKKSPTQGGSSNSQRGWCLRLMDHCLVPAGLKNFGELRAVARNMRNKTTASQIDKFQSGAHVVAGVLTYA